MEQVVVYNPIGWPQDNQGKFAKRVSLLNRIHIALLDNGKPNANVILDHVGKLLKESFPNIKTDHINKQFASKGASIDIINKISKNYSACITALGD